MYKDEEKDAYDQELPHKEKERCEEIFWNPDVADEEEDADDDHDNHDYEEDEEEDDEENKEVDEQDQIFVLDRVTGAVSC